MNLDASRREVPELVLLKSAASTNDELVALAGTGEPAPFTTVVTLDQTAGRGRLDRSWSAPAGTALAISVLVRPVDAVGRPVPTERLGWLPIAAGVAMTETVTEAAPAGAVSLKWPNDVLIGTRKVSGVLAEAVSGPVGGASGIAAVVLGAGVNLTIPDDLLPVPTATSLVIEGTDPVDLVDRTLSGYLRRLRSHVEAFLAAGANADSSGLHDRARELCGTLGSRVRVELPGDRAASGVARDIDASGRLVIATADGERLAVAAGDVTHLRPA